MSHNQISDLLIKLLINQLIFSFIFFSSLCDFVPHVGIDRRGLSNWLYDCINTISSWQESSSSRNCVQRKEWNLNISISKQVKEIKLKGGLQILSMCISGKMFHCKSIACFPNFPVLIVVICLMWNIYFHAYNLHIRLYNNISIFFSWKG